MNHECLSCFLQGLDRLGLPCKFFISGTAAVRNYFSNQADEGELQQQQFGVIFTAVSCVRQRRCSGLIAPLSVYGDWIARLYITRTGMPLLQRFEPTTYHRHRDLEWINLLATAASSPQGLSHLIELANFPSISSFLASDKVLKGAGITRLFFCAIIAAIPLAVLRCSFCIGPTLC